MAAVVTVLVCVRRCFRARWLVRKARIHRQQKVGPRPRCENAERAKEAVFRSQTVKHRVPYTVTLDYTVHILYTCNLTLSVSLLYSVFSIQFLDSKVFSMA